jgi:hypothetical protein
METATTTTHEARARNAKAFALAQVLFDHGATVANVAVLPPAGWSMAASLATDAELLGRTTTGKVRIVHVPGSDATVAAVARILGDLIAAANDAAAIADQYEAAADAEITNGPFVGMTVGEVDRMTVEQRAEHVRILDESAAVVAAEREECTHPEAKRFDHDFGSAGHLGKPKGVRTLCGDCGTDLTPDRRPTDSQGYRSVVGQLDATTAQAFNAFGQATR